MPNRVNTNERSSERSRAIINSLECPYCHADQGRLCITGTKRTGTKKLAQRIHIRRVSAWIKGEYPGSYRETGLDTR